MYIQHAPSQKIEDITGDGGVKKSTTKFGIGPIVSGNALCRIHYSAYLSGEVEPFDSTRMRNSHARIRIGSHGNGLRGLQIAISTMRKNEEAKFFIHPDYAYGELGVPPRIPGNATVIFEVEMVSFVNEAEDFDDGDVDDAERRSWRKIFNKLDPLHHEANDLYHHGDYRRAIKVYGKSIRIARDAALYSQEDEDQMNDFSAKMFLNVALCSLKLGNYKNTISMCKRVLSLKPDELKAFFRLAQAHRLNANYVKAKKFILIAKAKSQVNSDILEELAALSRFNIFSILEIFKNMKAQ
ncbi:hypothetical protein HZS_5971 [Henneguya salminicola]|nr:hypothetical protein HZS_5971 [Henneguya salminicola]